MKATSLDDNSSLEKQWLSRWEGLICPAFSLGRLRLSCMKKQRGEATGKEAMRQIRRAQWSPRVWLSWPPA